MFNIFNKHRKAVSTVKQYTIPFGDTSIEVYAESYRQDVLKALYEQNGKNGFSVSLTPPSPYQLEAKWPKMPFINLNLPGSSETTKENWLGYIPYGYGNKINFSDLLQEYDAISATATIIRSSGGYEVYLSVDTQQSKYARVLEVSVQHDLTHQKLLDVIYSKGIEKIDVELSEGPHGNIDTITYKGYEVGKLSATSLQKINAIHGNKSYILSLRYYQENRKKYSKLFVNN